VKPIYSGHPTFSRRPVEFAMNYPAWTVIELQRDQWWAADTLSGAGYLLPPQTGERLWMSPSLQRRALAQVLKSQADITAEPFVDLEFLGVSMRYLCEERTVAERISSLYASMIPQLRRSPDTLVKLGRRVDFDRLHRSVEGERDDVHVRPSDADEWTPGSSNLPIIPAMQSPALAGRFCALHAALLSSSYGGLLMCGERTAGKTTAALLARRLLPATVLAEETVLLDDMGRVYGVPLPIRERNDGERVARALPNPPPSAQINALVPSVIVVLEAATGAPSWTEVASREEQMRLLAPHLRVLDGPLGRATASLLRLLRGAQVWCWRQRSWPALAEDLEYGLRTSLSIRHDPRASKTAAAEGRA